MWIQKKTLFQYFPITSCYFRHALLVDSFSSNSFLGIPLPLSTFSYLFPNFLLLSRFYFCKNFLLIFSCISPLFLDIQILDTYPFSLPFRYLILTLFPSPFRYLILTLFPSPFRYLILSLFPLPFRYLILSLFSLPFRYLILTLFSSPFRYLILIASFPYNLHT